jgi:ABC-type uncharacterized transport system permease subunit
MNSSFWTEVFWASVIGGGLVAGMPLMLAAIGETISERAGVLNIGLEGMMLFGAYGGFLGAYYGHTQWLGYLAGGLAGMASSLIMVVLCVRLGLDQIVVGIAITLAGEGITAVLQEVEFGATYPPLVYLAIIFVGVLSWAFRATNIGLNLRAAGEKPEALDAAGVSVIATRSYAVLATGFLTGLGGAYLAVVGAGIFTPFITQGQGYMAIVIAMLGRGRPWWVLFGSLLFGITLSLSDSLQIIGITISTDVVHSLPFVAIIVALLLFARRSYLPPSLALPYVRGTR